MASVDLSGSDNESHYSRVLHPNEVKSARKIYTGCAKYFNRFDELIMKPIFIYKYEKKMQKTSKEFFDLFMKAGTEIERDYKNAKKVDFEEMGEIPSMNKVRS